MPEQRLRGGRESKWWRITEFAGDVFGPAAGGLMVRFRRAIPSDDLCAHIMWDVLRRCSRIPRENSGAKRRLAYAEAVLTMWETPDAYGHPDDDYLLAGDKGLRPIPTLRARWGAKQFGRIYDRLFDTMVRGEHDLARVERILQNAATKRFPARYIDAVIKNYEADKRVRRSQRQTKKCDFPK